MTTSLVERFRNLGGSVRRAVGTRDYADDMEELVEGENVRIGMTCGASAPPPLLQMSRQDCISPCSVKFFWGRIPRETAVTALRAKGTKQGLFLLREKTDHQRNFALSVMHLEKVHHYIIERCPDGMVKVPRGKTFPGPVELIQHHQKHQDGFLCRLTSPCERPVAESPLVFKTFTVKDLEEAVSREATRLNLSGAALLKNLGPQRATFENTVVRRLHEEMPWYHHMITRMEAEERIEAAGQSDGLFLVRISIQDQNANKKGTALTISFDQACRHYRISADTRDRVSIEKSSKFNSIMELIDHYYYNQDGLLHKLTTPCLVPGAKAPPNKRVSTSFPALFIPGTPPLPERGSTSPSPESPTPPPRRPPPPPPHEVSSQSPINRRPQPVIPEDDDDRPPSPPPRPSLRKLSEDPPDVSHESDLGLQDIWDEPPDDLPPPLIGDSGNPQCTTPETYGDVPKSLFKLNRREIMLQHAIGTGNFGAVLKGIWIHGQRNIQVAVKTLKPPEGVTVANPEELLKEAETMKNLEHDAIIKMLGVCIDGDPVMLILEFAPLGPLHKYLRKNKAFPIPSILKLMLQVAEGMAYLEARNMVHRDLAARNILLVNQEIAKISDFGLSKAIGGDADYYRAGSAGRWPLKWYAPEAIYFWKFDSRTDVWSFGVTLWEGVSYGAAPYKGKKGEEIISLIEAGRRLEQPPSCPDSVFSVLLKCWTYTPKARPTFQDVVLMMQEQLFLHGGTTQEVGAVGGS